MKIRASVLVWVLSLVFFMVSVHWLGLSLPDKVATHFGAAGQPNGWMPRSSHLLFFTLFGVGFSSFVIGVCYFVRLFPPSLLNVPHAEYWRSPEHYPEACDFLFHHSFWFGTVAALWLAAFHYLIVQANRAVPVALDSTKIGALTLVFLAGIALWVAALIWHFARVGNR